MRFHSFAMLVLVAGCSSPPARDNAAAATHDADARAVESAEQRAAHDVAARYLAALGRRDFASARACWADDGHAAGGSVAALGRAYAPYATLSLRAQKAGTISATGDIARVVVPVTGTAMTKTKGATRTLAGNIYLQRTLGGDPAGADAHGWHIWAADIRPSH